MTSADELLLSSPLAGELLAGLLRSSNPETAASIAHLSRVGHWDKKLHGEESSPFALITLTPESPVTTGEELESDKLRPLVAEKLFSVGDTGWNADGFVAVDSWEPTKSVATFFSNGILEVATRIPFFEKGRWYLLGERLDHLVIGAVLAAESEYWPHEVAVLDASLVNVGGVRLMTQPEGFPTASAAFPQEIVHGQQMISGTAGMISGTEGDADGRVRPLLDQLWRAAGCSRALSFDEQGLWKPWERHFGRRSVESG